VLPNPGPGQTLKFNISIWKPSSSCGREGFQENQSEVRVADRFHQICGIDEKDLTFVTLIPIPNHFPLCYALNVTVDKTGTLFNSILHEVKI
jgi:hypothetical protein